MSEKIKVEPQQPVRWGRVVVIPFLALALSVIGWLIFTQNLSTGATVSIIEQVDNRPLEVTVIKPTRTTVNPTSEVTVIANKEIVLGTDKLAMQFIGNVGSQKYYLLRFSNLGVGKKESRVVFKDESGAEHEELITITREAFSFPPGFDSVGPWENSEYTLDGNNLTAAVDKQHRLLEDYEPDDLLDLNKELGLFTLNNAMLRSEAAHALRDMLREMQQDTGKYVTVASGYRSYQTQTKTYSNWVRELGENSANEVSARPGHSEHQLGTTVDFVSEDTDWKITNQFGETAAGRWLSENAHRFGFIVPYNEDQSASGGYKEESWHFRYVGTSI